MSYQGYTGNSFKYGISKNQNSLAIGTEKTSESPTHKVGNVPISNPHGRKDSNFRKFFPTLHGKFLKNLENSDFQSGCQLELEKIYLWGKRMRGGMQICPSSEFFFSFTADPL